MRSRIAPLLFAMYSVVSYAHEPFHRDQSAEINGTHVIVNVDLAPLFLVEEFGRPSEGDDYKVSGIYTFISTEESLIFTVYDWKATNLADEDPGAPSPKDFWASKTPVEFRIGGKSKGANRFKAWLVQHYQHWQHSKGHRFFSGTSRVHNRTFSLLR